MKKCITLDLNHRDVAQILEEWLASHGYAEKISSLYVCAIDDVLNSSSSFRLMAEADLTHLEPGAPPPLIPFPTFPVPRDFQTPMAPMPEIGDPPPGTAPIITCETAAVCHPVATAEPATTVSNAHGITAANDHKPSIQDAQKANSLRAAAIWGEEFAAKQARPNQQ